MLMRSFCSLFLLAFLAAHRTLAKTAGDGIEPKVLVFGGNGFLGSDTVDMLVKTGYNVTTVTRGSGYWDASERIFPKVTNIKCDRNEGLQTCKEFQKLILDDSLHFDAVVDFTAKYPQQVKEATTLVKEMTDLYILISSDVIYDASKSTEGKTKLKEEDGQRPSDEEEKELIQRVNPLGGLKLTSEEELIEQQKNGGLPYVILRVPDIIGPRDSTHRWWMYQLWLKVQREFPEESIMYPEYMETFNFSFVYSQDVAEVITKLVKRDLVSNNEVFNLAWEETFTLRRLFNDMCQELGLKEPNIKVLDQYDRRAHTFRYPSSRRGPLDVSKAIAKLQWKPTPWADVVHKTTTFFEEAMKSETFHNQMNEVIQVVETSALRDANKTKLYEILEAMYGITLNHFKQAHDEL